MVYIGASAGAGRKGRWRSLLRLREPADQNTGRLRREENDPIDLCCGVVLQPSSRCLTLERNMDEFTSIHKAESAARYIIEQRDGGWLREFRGYGDDLFLFAVCLSLRSVSPYQVASLPLASIEGSIRQCYSDFPMLMQMHREYSASKLVWCRLWERERDRREALWKLQSIEPGQPEALIFLEVLDRIDLDDDQDPIGNAGAATPSDLAGMVPIIKEQGRIDYVSDDDIPEPWRERFNQASTGSTRSLDGAYAGDWLKFLRWWQLEMERLRKHREYQQKLNKLGGL